MPASVVSIKVVVDEDGSVSKIDQIGTKLSAVGVSAKNAGNDSKKAFDDIGKGAEDAGKKSEKGFNGIEKAEQQAHIAGKLLLNTVGIEMPRQFERVLASSKLIGPALQSAFGFAIAATAITSLIEVGKKIFEVSQTLGGYTEEVKKFEEENKKASHEAFINPAALEAAKQHLDLTNEELQKNQKLAGSLQERANKVHEETSLFGQLVGIQDLRIAKEFLFNSAIDKGIELERERQAIIIKQKVLLEERNKLQDQIDAKNNQRGLEGGTLAQRQFNDFLESREHKVKVQLNPEGAALDTDNALADFETATEKANKNIEAANNAAEVSFLHGFAKIAAERDNAVREIAKQHTLPGTTQVDAEGQQLILDKKKEFAAQEADLARSNAHETIALRKQVETETLTGIQKIVAEEKFAIQEVDQKQKLTDADRINAQQRRVLLHKQTLDKIFELEKGLQQRVTEEDNKAALSQVANSPRNTALLEESQAIEKINREEKELHLETLNDEKKVSEFRALFERLRVDTHTEASNKIRQIDKQDDEKRTQILENSAEQIKDAEPAIALSTVDPWRKAYAQITVESNKRIEEIDKAERAALKDEKLTGDEVAAITQSAEARRAQVHAETDEKIIAENKKTTEQLGSELQSVFDDISGGNIGKRILDNIKKLFFQIVAQWILSLGIMKSQAGSIFGSLVFGQGSTGAGVLGGGSGTGTGGGIGGLLGGLFGGGTNANPASASGSVSAGSTSSSIPSFTGGSSTSALPGGTQSSSTNLVDSLFGGTSSSANTSSQSPQSFGSSITSGLVSGAVNPSNPLFGLTSSSNGLSTQSVSSSLGNNGAIADSLTGKPNIGGALGSIATKGKAGLTAGSLAGLAPIIGGLLGGLAGGKVGQLGGSLAGIALLASISPGLFGNGALAGVLPQFAAIAGGGLIGFGVGQQHGVLAGAISGAGAGLGLTGLLALLGFSAGPIGFIAAGIVGLLGGIFGGLFGGNKRKKQANKFNDDQIKPEVDKILNEYKSFQLDGPSATQQLKDLEKTAETELKKLKGEGKDVFRKKVDPEIQAALKQIVTLDTERQRRAGLTFGPPQFHDGGFVSSAASAFTRQPDEVAAILKHGEFVVNPTATAKNLRTLEKINRGEDPSGGGDTHIHIHAWDTRSVDTWLRTGGAQQIQSATNRLRVEGH